MNSYSAALRLTVNAYQSTLDKDVFDAMTAAASEIDRLEQEHEVTKLRLDAANESITGCAQRVQSLTRRLRECADEIARLRQELREQEAMGNGWHKRWKEATSLLQNLGTQEPTSEKCDQPPCIECGAISLEEAETMCRCAGDRDHCHGCELWP